MTVDGLTGEARKIADLFLKDEKSRDSYSVLVAMYWIEYEGQHLRSGDFKKLTSPEFITRLSRKIQNDLGMFTPTQDTQKKRDASITDFQKMEVVK